jgi:hypothetical protein
MTRSLHIIAGATLLFTSAANAADAPSFAAAAASSAEKFRTAAGGHYGVAFMKSAGKALVPAAQACKDSSAPVGSYHDIVFIVSASGRIEHMIHGQRNAYGNCVTSRLNMPTSVAKPPSGSWPIHIRFLHGKQRRDEQPPFMVVSDDATSGVARDGSTQERAIINSQPVGTHTQWEYRYLDKHFPGRKPVDHRIAADAATRRVWSVFAFMWRGRKMNFWFDVTQPFREYAGSTREYREFAKPPPSTR